MINTSHEFPINITNAEYAAKLSKIRVQIFELATEMGAIYSTCGKFYDKIVKDARDADLVVLAESPNF